MRARVALLLALVALVGATGGSAATRPSLRPVGFAPLTVAGKGFASGESVTVAAYGGARRVIRGVASGGGAFRPRVSSSQPRCTAWVARAAGSSGSRATYRVLPAACAPAIAAGTAPPTRGTGVAGVITRGPITPVCAVEVPCDGPAAGVAVDLLQANVVIAHTKTGVDGRYYVLAAPGNYVVRATGRLLSPRVTRVQAGRFAEVDFKIDTGIR